MNGKELTREITAALSDASLTPAQLTELVQACDNRVAQIRARLLEIEPQTHGDPKEREQALRAGIDKLRALDEEARELHRELDFLEQIGSHLYEARERAIDAVIRRELPKARKALPGALARVRDAQAALLAAVDRTNALTKTLAEYSRLETKSFPLSDDELGELLELRLALWTGARLDGLIPPNAYQRSTSAFVERRGDTVRVRRPGDLPWADELGDAVTAARTQPRASGLRH